MRNFSVIDVWYFNTFLIFAYQIDMESLEARTDYERAEYVAKKHLIKIIVERYGYEINGAFDFILLPRIISSPDGYEIKGIICYPKCDLGKRVFLFKLDINFTFEVGGCVLETL